MLLGNSPLASGPLAAQAGPGADPPVTISANIAVTATASAGVTRLAVGTPAATSITAPAVSANRCRLHFPIPPDAPTLYYFCAAHSAMGGATNHSSPTTNTYVVTVVSGKFYLNGVKQPTVSLAPGGKYTFDQSHSSNASHPLRFSLTAGGTHYGSGSVYSNGVSYVGTRGQTGAATIIQIPAAANVTATASARSIVYPIVANVNLAVNGTATPTRQRPIAGTPAATEITATATGRAIRFGSMSASTAVNATFTLLPDPLGYATKSLLTGAIPEANRTASISAVSVSPAIVKYASATATISVSGTAASLQYKGTTATVEIAINGTAESLGFLRTTTGAAQVAVNAAGGPLYDLKSTTATAAISAGAAGVANRVRQVNAIAPLAVNATAAPKATFTTTGVAAINVTPGIVSAGKDKFASAAVSTAVTASAKPTKIQLTSAAASAAITASATSIKLTLKITSANAATAVTATAACVGVKSTSAIAPILVTGVSVPRAIFGGVAASNIAVSATAIGNATTHVTAAINISITSTAIPRRSGEIWIPSPAPGGSSNIWVPA